MDDINGKEIWLVHTTVKIPGMMKPRGSTKGGMSTNGLLKSQLNDLSQGRTPFRSAVRFSLAHMWDVLHEGMLDIVRTCDDSKPRICRT